MKDIEVSVMVVCYNSEKTILESLESVKKQTYPCIHLLISDDNSSDNTYEIIEEWSKKNKSRFLTLQVFRNEKNMGTSKHMNARLMNLRTEWFKGLAADDMLLPDCIENYVKFIKTNNCHGMVYANHVMFNKSLNSMNIWVDYEELIYQKRFSEMPAEKQLKKMAIRDPLCSPTCFSNKEDIISCGGYDERIKNIEDWPVKMRLLQNGFKMNHMNRYTVMYRVGDSESRSEKLYFKPDHMSQRKLVQRLYCDRIVGQNLAYKWNNRILDLRIYLTLSIMKNKRNTLTRVINIIISLVNLDKLRKSIYNIIYKRKCKKITESFLRKYKSYIGSFD